MIPALLDVGKGKRFSFLTRMRHFGRIIQSTKHEICALGTSGECSYISSQLVKGNVSVRFSHISLITIAREFVEISKVTYGSVRCIQRDC